MAGDKVKRENVPEKDSTIPVYKIGRGKRKVIQIATVLSEIGDHTISNKNDPMIIALCDDGTVWSKKLYNKLNKWEQVPNVPQPKKGKQKDGEKEREKIE